MEPAASATGALRSHPKPLRKRARSESDDEHGVNVNAIKDLREEHKYRERSSGLDAHKMLLAQQNQGKVDTAKAEQSTTVAAATGLAGFDAVGKVGIDPLQIAKQAFIQQRLKQLRGEDLNDQPAVAQTRSVDPWLQTSATEDKRGHIDAEELLSNPDKMYELPSHLQPLRYSRTAPTSGQGGGAGSSTERTQGGAGVGAASGDGSGTGGVMLAGTGITEVALPAESRAQSLAATERAIAAYVAKRAQQRGTKHGTRKEDEEAPMHGRMNMITGSLTANYAGQRKEYAQNMRSEARARQAASQDQHQHMQQEAGGVLNEQGGGSDSVTHSEGVGLAEAQRPSTRPVHSFAAAVHGGDGSGHGVGSGRTHASDDKAFKTFRARELGAMRNK